MHYKLYFLGEYEKRVGRSTSFELETDIQAQQRSQALARLFDGVETWDGTRLVCRFVKRRELT